MHGHSQRGQATVGYALVVGIALIGTITVVALGATALTDIQDSSGAGAAEQAMTQFDSRTARVALGDSRDQTVSIGQTDGTYSVDPDAGYVRIVHTNFSGGTGGDGNRVSDGPNDDDHVLYESTLGTVQYEGSDTGIAYQAGGVWRRTQSGSTMVSPPEFHYRGSTLTFPIVRVNNETELPTGTNGVQAGSGRIDLQVSQSGDSRDIYPTQENGYPDTNPSDGVDDGFNATGNRNPYGNNGTFDDGDGDGGYYDNPATNGTVVVYIESEYYRAWADYFRTRTDGTVDTSDTPDGLVDGSSDPQGDGDDEGVVAVELSSTGFSGPFTMPPEASSLFLRGIEDHSLSEFKIEIVPDMQDAADFSNLKWSMYVSDGDEQFEMYLESNNNGNGCKNNEETDITADLNVYYSNDGGTTYQGWHGDNVFEAQCEDRDGDGLEEEIVLRADFVDDENGNQNVTEIEANDSSLTYVSEDGSDGLDLLPAVENPDGTATTTYSPADQEDHGFGWETKTYQPDSGDTESVDRVVNHYFSVLGPGFDLTVDDKSGGSVSESGSSGVVRYVGGSSFVTYMHITENDVVVRID